MTDQIPNDVDWPVLIGQLIMVKQQIHEVDKTDFYPWHLPKVAATPDEVHEAEQALGFRLAEGHRNFLLHANGWDGFFIADDLLGTDALPNNAAAAQTLFDITSEWPDEMFTDVGLRRDDLFVIAFSEEDNQVFVMQHRDGYAEPGVTWLFNGIGEQWPTFEHFYLDMLRYNVSNIETAHQYAVEDGLA